MKTKHLFATVLFILLIFPWVAAAAPVGKITNLQGNVDITIADKAARIVITGDNVNVGDIVRTKSNSKIEITFNEGNILRLGENTRVGITEYLSGEKQNSSIFNLFRGKIQNIVKAISVASGGRYEVHTTTAVIGVRGTRFFVATISGQTDVAVLEGTVAATSYFSADGTTPPKTVTVSVNASQHLFMFKTAPPQLRSISDTQLHELINTTEISGSSSSASGAAGTYGPSLPPPETPPPALTPPPTPPAYNPPPVVIPPQVQPSHVH